jgi:transcriptional regulator with XRE-family HTH domain
MAAAAVLIRDTRRQSGLTQSELARRMGVKQSVIARLEGRRSNPTLATIDRALEAMGHRLEISAVERPSSIDETLIVSNLRLTPAERLAAFERSYANMLEFVHELRRSDG